MQYTQWHDRIDQADGVWQDMGGGRLVLKMVGGWPEKQVEGGLSKMVGGGRWEVGPQYRWEIETPQLIDKRLTCIINLARC